MTKEELLAEEYICNGKCQDDITRNYVHCKTCTRLKDFLAGYKVGKTDLEKENAELKGLVNQYKASKCGSISLVNRNMIMFDQLTKAKEYIKLLLMNCVGVYESTGKTIAEIQAEAEQFLSEVEK